MGSSTSGEQTLEGGPFARKFQAHSQLQIVTALFPGTFPAIRGGRIHLVVVGTTQ
jgi:hypothetical protein